MSIVDLPALQGGPPQELGRTPPQDVAAEQSVLGGMMLSKDAIADVIEVLRVNDFYRPAHETIYEAVLDLYGRGEPADAVTIADELTKRGELSKVGGLAYLHTLISSVPTAANAGFYARIVRERAILRRLVSAGTKIVQLGYGGTDGRGGGDVDEIVNSAQAEVYAVTETRSSEDYAPLSEVIEGAIDEIEASSHRGDGMTGVPTGFADLDRLTNGFHAGQMIVIAARPAMGKALALDTPLATPSGWTTMGAVQVGDELIGADGRPCYEVSFSDGSTIVADASHQWLTETRASRRSAQQATTGHNRHRSQQTFAAVRTTEQIAATLRCDTSDRRLNHSVTNTAPLDLPERELPIPPYALGAWLVSDARAASAPVAVAAEVVTGIDPLAGSIPVTTRRADDHAWVRISTGEPGVAVRLEADGLVAVPNGVTPAIFTVELPVSRDALGQPGAGSGVHRQAVPAEKRVPQDYLRASPQQRRAVLAGLLDSAGSVGAGGGVQVSVVGENLARDVLELVVALGYRCTIAAKRSPGRTEKSSAVFTLNFSTDDDVFELESKRLLHKERRSGRSVRWNSRFVTAVRPVASVPVRCVEVAGDSHLYLAGPSMIPTHNSTLGLDIIRSAAIHHQMASVMFSLEMSRNEITMRLLSAEARIPLQNMRKGTMREEDWTRLAKTMGDVSDAPFFIDDSPNMSLMEIRAKCRRLKQRHDLKLVVIDYLQLMTSGKRVESRQQEVSEFSRALKLLAKEVQVPVIALSQLNRGPEQRTDKKPQMSDLRESGCLTADTRVLRADTGAEITLGELYTQGTRDVPVWTLDHSLRYVRRHLTHVFPTGVKPVFRVRLASGKEVRATANHPFLTYEGWTPIGGLAVGARVAVPRHVPAPESVATGWDDHRVMLAASTAHREIPAEVFCLPKRQISLFLRIFWSIGGSATRSRGGQVTDVRSPSAGRHMIDDIARLLLRFGISGRIVAEDAGSECGIYFLRLQDQDDRRRFLNEIGMGNRYDEAVDRHGAESLVASSGMVAAEGEHELWEQVRSVLVAPDAVAQEGATMVVNAHAGSMDVSGLVASRERLGQVADLLGEADLEMYAVNDVLWDTVVSVEPDGVERVFDATVVGTHNFVANGIAVHNSIEQDADMVILLHREDAYEKESPRAGEADFIVAKHRNGPTDTITVAFQGHYSRFVDMAT